MLEFIAANSFARLIFLFLLFGLVVFTAAYLSSAATKRSRLKAQLQSIGGSSDRQGRPMLEVRRDSAWSRLADQIEKAGLNLSDSNADDLKQKLLAAGYTSPAAPRLFVLARLIMIFVLPILYLFYSTLSAEPLSFFRMYVVPGMLAVLGMYLPNLIVSAKADRRREAMTNGFPDCLDLILVCVEAGLGLESAMDRVGREMVHSHPLVARLLLITTLQLRAGSARDDALRKMGTSSGVDEIRSFATLLIQSDKLGTSVADTLRVYAAEMREKRRMRAEEKAHRLPVLISIPLVICMLPTMIGVLMIPGVVRVVRVMLPAMSGG
ncbi:type II secretion system F family protein [Allopontixanthobacter sp.]|uniref:type II secretion system F family protein n=1 Tax=Allopontixanthobacter sp. TaxID=2906452 RepID=UPI002ABB289A|nr:type II secretion system F family protein [Allopontixanthobacter sp.]MDZ4306992.1 type II secretion system F family protein [Allopontixanthobacter sp.]